MHSAIEVEHLTKKYLLGSGQATAYRTLRETISSAFKIPRRKRSAVDRTDVILALSDVSFSVTPGEVVGIIGRNGAGKSTLLKVLSRITEPTAGRVRVFGRIGSLLEVGSGFHPELSGRENIFLNGAILGMRRSEIVRKFDEIVAFAEVERFIDTPVKRYSSGMYLRLAFAVAAHLEPEILVIDEVLAVGDYDFQNKCLGKMKDVAGQGRTVLFVSHNMGAVQHLCQRAILLEEGCVSVDDTAAVAVNAYLGLGIDKSGERRWDLENAPTLDDAVRLRAIRTVDLNGETRSVFDVKEAINVEVEYDVLRARYSLNVHLYFQNETGQTLFVAMDNTDSPWCDKVQPTGSYRATCRVPKDFLNEGTIRIEYLICTRPTSQYFVTVPDAVAFQVTDDRSPEGSRSIWSRDWPASMVRPRIKWTVEGITEADAPVGLIYEATS